jgi:hypothetical protein
MFAPPSPFSPAPVWQFACGVGHVTCDPVEAASDVRRIDGASRDIDPPNGVVFTFQVKGNSVEPTIASRSRNLLSHNDSGPSGTDEAKEVRPQVPWIVCPKSFSCDAKRLARAAARPNFMVVWPSGEAQSISPPANSGEEVCLLEASQIVGLNIDN